MLNYEFLILNVNVIKTRDGLGTYPELPALELNIGFPNSFKIHNSKLKIDVSRLTSHVSLLTF